MKMIRPKSLLNLFYTIFLLVPMAAIGVRVAYITFNKNAKDSYSGTTTYEINYKFESNNVTSVDDLIDGNIYYVSSFNLSSQDVNDLLNDYVYLYVIKTSGIDLSWDTEYFNDYGSSDSTSLEISGDSYNLTCNFNTLSGYCSVVFETYDYIEFNDCIFWWSSDLLPLITDGTLSLPQFTDYNEIESVNIDNSGTLDNAFTYSIHELIDNNLGKVNFFTWFGNMFLDMSKPQTALYINFVNWYFNYILLVSLGYLLFYVIMWFINYVRKLLDHNDTFGHGGY